MTELAATLIEEVVKSVFGFVRDRFVGERFDSKAKEVTLKLSTHLTEISNWSQDTQFYGMPSAESINEKTVELTFATLPRQFRGARGDYKRVDENSLLADYRNIVLLGDPGAGKTTTIKRLVQRVLLQPPQTKGDTAEYPIAILLRNFPHSGSVVELVADALGLEYEYREVKAAKISDAEAKMEPVIQNERLDHFVADLMNSTGAILLLDGLDEVSAEVRPKLEASIAALGYRLSSSKIIVSCRSGDFTRHMDGFTVLEIWPLTEEQVHDVARRWLVNPDAFFEQLNALPFEDLANRPLFLCQLIVLYRNNGDLPDEPAEVYRRIVSLLLEDWDRTRGIQRKSKYSKFSPSRKLEFLSVLAYQLTYKLKVKVFRREDLVIVYESSHKLFALPVDQAMEVAREIETHTGIIVQSGPNHFEFSHLSVQEYLCAYYLVRSPFTDSLISYMREYPAPVAVAVSLSLNPGAWLKKVVLNQRTFSVASWPTFSSFLSRLYREKPKFVRSVELGIALVAIIFRFRDAKEIMLSIVTDPEVAFSIADALCLYYVDYSRSSTDSLWLSRPNVAHVDVEESPRQGAFPSELINILSGITKLELKRPETGTVGNFMLPT